MSAQAVVRAVIELLVLASIWGWTSSLVRSWVVFTRRARRVSTAILALLVANGAATWYSASHAYPITAATWFLLMVFIVLNVSMLWHPANDDTTERQYEHLFLWLRRRR